MKLNPQIIEINRESLSLIYWYVYFLRRNSKINDHGLYDAPARIARRHRRGCAPGHQLAAAQSEMARAPEVPPHSMNVEKGKVLVRIHMHRIPEHHIKVFVAPGYLEVDTLTWSKKLQLK